jgi:hypothetical protein
MQSTLSFSRLAAVAAACAFSLHAQCYDITTGATVGTGDDTVLAAQTLPFAFPFNGSTYTTVHPCTNGFVYLGNGTASTNANCCTGAIATMTAATSPMIAPWWTDLNVVLGTGAVKFNATASKAVVTWENAIEYGGSTATGQFSMQLQLYPTGEMDFCYDSRVAVLGGHVFLVGMSPGSGAVAGPATDFSIVGTGATNTNFQLFGPAIGPVSLAASGVHFVPTVPGYVWVPTSCPSASHTSYGSGCYRRSNSFYENFLTAAAFDLAGSSMTMINTGTGYTMVTGLAAYVPPSGLATALALGDDTETPVTLGSAFPYPGGSTSSLTVCSNGFISVATGNGTSFLPTVSTMLNAPQVAWWSWHDFNPLIAGSGQVKFEQVGSVAYVTWDGVYSYATTNAETMQWQFDTTNGNVSCVWTTIGGFGNGFLVGYSPAGASSDPGSTDLSVQLPLTFSTSAVEMTPLALSASPAPISTPSIGTVVTYTTSNIPEYIPTSGLYIAINILSLGQIPAPGIDLIVIGAPGCPAFVSSLDVTQAMVGASNSQSVTFSIPPGLPGGLAIYSQSAAMVQPFSLPNGQNAFGLTTSNGIASVIQAQ